MARKKKSKCPDYSLLIEPTWCALVRLGGSGTNNEIDAEIIKQLDLPDEVIDEPHKETGNETELAYRAKWARTYLKKYGLIENSARGVWSIAPQYQKMVEQVEIDKNEIIRAVRQEISSNRNDEGRYRYCRIRREWSIGTRKLVRATDIVRECHFSSRKLLSIIS